MRLIWGLEFRSQAEKECHSSLNWELGNNDKEGDSRVLCLLIPANSIHNEKLYCMSSLYIYSPVNIQVTAYIPSKDLSELEAFVCVLVFTVQTRENRCSIRHNM